MIYSYSYIIIIFKPINLNLVHMYIVYPYQKIKKKNWMFIQDFLFENVEITFILFFIFFNEYIFC